jgi:hypothetical protein
MSSHHKKQFWIWPLLSLLSMIPVFGEEFLLGDVFGTLGLNDLPAFYGRFDIAVDSILVMIFFIFITSAASEKIGKHLGKKPFIVIGVILGFSFMIFENTSGFRLIRDFGPIAAVIFGITFMVFMWGILKSHTKNTMWSSLAVFLGWIMVETIVGIMRLGDTLQQNQMLGMGMGILRIAGFIALVVFAASALKTFGSRGAGGTGGSGGGGGRTNFNTSPRDIASIPGLGAARNFVDGWRRNKMDKAQQSFSQLENNLTTFVQDVEQKEQQINARDMNDISQVIQGINEALKLYEETVEYEKELAKMLARNKTGGAYYNQSRDEIRTAFQRYHDVTGRIINLIEPLFARLADAAKNAQIQHQLEASQHTTLENGIRNLKPNLKRVKDYVDKELRGVIRSSGMGVAPTIPQLNSQLQAEVTEVSTFINDLDEIQKNNKALEQLTNDLQRKIRDLHDKLNQFKSTYQDTRVSNVRLARKRKNLVKQIRNDAKVLKSDATKILKATTLKARYDEHIGKLNEYEGKIAHSIAVVVDKSSRTP